MQERAESLLGMPYQYGVTDCSYYTQQVYQPFVNLPRVSRAQYRFKQTNQWPILQPLRFFSFSGDGRVTHATVIFADTIYHNSVKNQKAVKVPLNQYWKVREVQ